MTKQAQDRIGIIGGGSWGTALVKVLSENSSQINWWVRKPETVDYINKFGRNPKYLRYAELNQGSFNISSSIKNIFLNSDWIVLVVPAPFLHETLKELNKQDFQGKKILSAIKGIVPETNSTVGDYLFERHGVQPENYGVISGPSHSEEVVMQKLSFLTIACNHFANAEYFSKKLSRDFIKVNITNDVAGIEYAAILKNIYAIANGITIGLGYGDNFQAVLISNSIKEAKVFLDKINKVERNINDSVYMGDLIVTAYSSFSRNRMLGSYIGKGYSVKATLAEMKMIAEGYYASKSIMKITEKLDVKLPICETVYNIVHKENSPGKEFANLETCLT